MKIVAEVRTAAHYRRLLEINPHASIGFVMAANAVYAARHGTCEAWNQVTPDWRAIAADLHVRYGDHLEAVRVLEEMESPAEPESKAV